MKQVLWYAYRKLGLGPLLLRLHAKSGLRKLGWFRSFRERRSVDLGGGPIPWWTHAFIAFMQDRLTNSLRILEFGAGNSTLWLGQRVAEVVSYENDPTWAALIRTKAPPKVSVVLCESLEAVAADLVEEQDTFDIIIIDAGNRIEIAKHVLGKTSVGGCVIWDNTDGPDWPQIRDVMAESGFREISFAGLTAQEVALSRTTLFYRPDNVLGV